MERGCTATMLKQKCSRRSGWENHATTKKARQSRSNVKVMLRAFCDWKGIVHHEFVPRGETVNREFYLKVMKRLWEAVRR